jgi:hypothetical protein
MVAPVPQTGDSVPVVLDNILINVQNCEKPIPNPKGRHCALNVLDIFKDARIDPDATVKSIVLPSVMSDIFPPTCYKTGGNYSVTKLHQEEDYYMNDKAITGAELRIAALSKKALNDTVLNNVIDAYINSEIKSRIPDFISGSIPETYKYALNDAAITPNDFRPGIQEIETPGSYIDPGGRKIGDYTWPLDNQELKIDLTNFGFENIIFSSKFFFNAGDPTRYCSINLKKGGTVLMNVVVDRTGAIVDPLDTPNPQQYFLGNNIKNTFLNNPRSDKTTAINFVLGKELGDTLQVIIGYIMMKANPREYNETKLAAFTGDIPFACRCMMLNLPVLLRRLKYNSKNSVLRHYSFFTPLNLNPEEKLIMINNAKIDDIIKHNVGVRFRIIRFIAEPNIEDYIGDTRKVKPQEIKDIITLLLNEIIAYIEYINAHLVPQRGSPIYDINVYEGYRAFDVCSVIKKKTKLNPLLTRLMDNISDPISGTISDPITKILEGNNCRTTGEYYKKIHKIVQEEAKERNNAARDARRQNFPGGSKHSGAPERNLDNPRRTLYQPIASKSLPKKRVLPRTPLGTSAKTSSLQQIRYNVDKAEEYSYYIVDILFNYYKYVGGTIIGSDFFGLVTQYILETGLPTLSEFEQIYDNFKNVEFDHLPNIGKDYNYDSGDIFETNTIELREQMYNFLLQSDFFETYLNTIYAAEAPPPPIVDDSRSNNSSTTSMTGRLSRHSLSKNSTRALPSFRPSLSKNSTRALPSFRPYLQDIPEGAEGGRKERKHKTRKHKTRKHKTRKHKTRKHKTRKHKTRKNRK